MEWHGMAGDGVERRGSMLGPLLLDSTKRRAAPGTAQGTPHSTGEEGERRGGDGMCKNGMGWNGMGWDGMAAGVLTCGFLGGRGERRILGHSRSPMQGTRRTLASARASTTSSSILVAVPALSRVDPATASWRGPTGAATSDEQAEKTRRLSEQGGTSGVRGRERGYKRHTEATMGSRAAYLSNNGVRAAYLSDNGGTSSVPE